MRFLFPLCLSLVMVPNAAMAQVAASASSANGDNAGAASSGALGVLGVTNTDQTTNTSEVSGTVVNQGINNSASGSLPSFTSIRDIRCEQATFEASLFGTNGLNQFNGGIVGTLRVPLGNQAHDNCLALSENYLNQSRYDTYINVVRFCKDNEDINLSAAPVYIQTVCNSLRTDNE